MSLSELLERVRAFGAGDASLKALQQAWLPQLVAPLPDEPPEDESSSASAEVALFWQLVWLFESDAAETQHREHARRVVACMDQTGSPATTLSLLRLLVDQDRFCGVVAKHRTGVVSLTGLRSVIAESRYDMHVKQWLALAAPSLIAELCANLHSKHYAAVAELISRPPA